MLLTFFIGVAPLEPDASDPEFWVDEPGFRVEFHSWPAPAPRRTDADLLCTLSLSASRTDARAELVDCPPEVAPAALDALRGWKLRASSAPDAETEVLRLTWLFRAEGTVEGFVSAPGAVAHRLPPELVEVLDRPPPASWSGCVECPAWECRVRVEVDAGGRPTATGVSRPPTRGDCPPEAWEAARAAAIDAQPWPVVGADGWPVPYVTEVPVQVRRSGGL